MKKVPFRIGDSQIFAQVTERGDARLTMINLHEDEQTSVRAARAVIQRNGGRFIELLHTGTRRVRFSLDGSDYSFDPNRIFTPAGIHNTLRGETISDQAYAAVAEFAEHFVRFFALSKQRSLIALHNNGDGGFSIHSYEVGSDREGDAARVHVDGSADPDDFYYVTDELVFERLREQNFNVILQSHHTVEDDGSLSVYAGRSRVVYINVEAENGHLEEQIRMLDVATRLLLE